MNRRGFTIIEIIIVITIMGILITLGVVNLRGSQANSRDAERKVDIETLAQHLETYYTSGTTNDSVTDKCTSANDTVSYVGGYTIHQFTTVGSWALGCTGSVTAEVLVVAGGGGGGAFGGGGGGGGLKYIAAKTLTGSNAVVVGAGGNGDTTYNSTATSSTNGGNSSFGSIIAVGGGGGGSRGGACPPCTGVGGSSGGSGGGGSPADSGSVGTAGIASPTGQGNNGGVGSVYGWGGGGGGGAGAVGANATAGGASKGGDGGVGLSYSISGSAVFYSGGGGGDAHDGGTIGTGGKGGGGDGGYYANGVAGTANTGGGGGGGGAGSYVGGNGGSGIVIVRYLSASNIATYPSTAIASVPVPITEASVRAYLRDIDVKSITAPGISNPATTFIPANNNLQTTATFTTSLGAITIDQYVYQPLHSDGTLCNDTLECNKFNLFYKLEVANISTACPSPGFICKVTSINQ